MMTSNSITYEKNKKEESPVLECCGVCCLMIFGLALIGGIISYLVFGIMYLVEDYNVAHDCDGSSLWAYVLTAVILSFSRSGAKNTSTDSDSVGTTVCMLVCLGLIEAGLAIWGGIELWTKSCDDLSNSNLWKFGLATFIIQTFCASIFLVIIPAVMCCLVICEKKKNDSVERVESAV